MTNIMQLFGSFICTQSTLHVPGDDFAHHQEHLTVFTASDIVHLCCCRPPAGSNIGGQTQKLKLQSSAPDDGRNRPKHVELIGHN